MTNYNAAAGERAVHAKALGAAAEDVATLGGDFSEVEVTVYANTAPVYFTADGTPATVAGGNTYVIPAGGGSLTVGVPTGGNTVVRLISAAGATYHVAGVS